MSQIHVKGSPFSLKMVGEFTFAENDGEFRSEDPPEYIHLR